MSPVPCWWPPAGIWTNVFGWMAWASDTDGWVAFARPYRLPVATCVTGRNTWPALTVSVVAAVAADADGAYASPTDTNAVAATTAGARTHRRLDVRAPLWTFLSTG